MRTATKSINLSSKKNKFARATHLFAVVLHDYNACGVDGQAGGHTVA